MKLLFLGDIASPEEKDVQAIKKLAEKDFFKEKIVIGNLEGLLVDTKEPLKEYPSALFNHVKLLDVFNNSKRTILSLANNHIKDIPSKFNYTIQKLQENNIGFCGASEKKNETGKPFEFVEEGKKVAIFMHCWSVMSNIIHKKSQNIFINDIDYEKFIEQIEMYKKDNKNTYIIVYFHWNFDFEKLPFPAHRIISKKLIDVGANVVIGGHSHIVNGAESYKNGIIAYGLGNFYIPSNKFLNGKLKYPKDSDISLVLEIDTEQNKSVCHWVKNKKNENIEIISQEDFGEGELINKYSPFRTMDEKGYRKYFKINRKKKTLVPIWYNEKNDCINRIKNVFIITRMKLIRALKKIK